MITTEADTFPDDPVKASRYLTTAINRFNGELTTFIPVEEGRPCSKEWNSVTWEKAQRPEYRSDLPFHDLAVACGRQSHSLAAIQFHTDDARLDFLARNPPLKDALRTSAPRGYFVWIRIENDGSPVRDHEHPLCDLICEGPILVATREKNSGYRFDNDGHPTLFRLKDIIWPNEVGKLRAAQAVEDNYPMTVIGKHGEAELSDDYVVAVFKALNPEVSFNPVTGWFHIELPEGQVQRLYDEQVKKNLYSVLTKARLRTRKQEANPPWLADLIAQGQVPAPAKEPPLRIDTGPRHLNTLVELLKILTVKPSAMPDEAEADANPPQLDEAANALDDFVLKQLEEAPGATLTVSEAFSAYVDYCSVKDHPRYSARQFHDRFAEAVKNCHDIEKSHDIVRDNRHKRGFHNLRLKLGEIEASRTDRTPRTDDFVRMDRCHSNLTAYLATAM